MKELVIEYLLCVFVLGGIGDLVVREIVSFCFYGCYSLVGDIDSLLGIDSFEWLGLSVEGLGLGGRSLGGGESLGISKGFLEEAV